MRVRLPGIAIVLSVFLLIGVTGYAAKENTALSGTIEYMVWGGADSDRIEPRFRKGISLDLLVRGIQEILGLSDVPLTVKKGY